MDTRQTNLTRFPLFFPEKRTFFLQGADIFQFGHRHRRGPAAVLHPAHRAGRGQEAPILAGLKMTGRVGVDDLGALVVRTREAGRAGAGRRRWGVRLQRNVLAESSIGIARDVRRSPGAARELGGRRRPPLPDVALPREQELHRRRLGAGHGTRRPRRRPATARRSA